MTKDVRLFVYGSLKVGFRHADVLRDAIRVCSASAEPFSLVRYGRYPALVASPSGVVHGELVLVDQALLLQLDEFEQCPNLYQRQAIPLRDGLLAYAYVIDSELEKHYSEIPGGIWRE